MYFLPGPSMAAYVRICEAQESARKRQRQRPAGRMKESTIYYKGAAREGIEGLQAVARQRLPVETDSGSRETGPQ